MNFLFFTSKHVFDKNWRVSCLVQRRNLKSISVILMVEFANFAIRLLSQCLHWKINFPFKISSTGIPTDSEVSKTIKNQPYMCKKHEDTKLKSFIYECNVGYIRIYHEVWYMPENQKSWYLVVLSFFVYLKAWTLWKMENLQKLSHLKF